MSGPVEGEPFFAYAGLRISAGDIGAAPGTDAWKAVVVLDPTGMPSANIIDAGAAFNVEVRIRTALAGIGFPLPPTLSVAFHVHDLTGTPAAGSPFAGTAPAPIATPGTDHGPDGPFDVVTWYSSTTAPIALPNGTYRITVHGHEAAAGLMFFHDGTVVHVGT